jgi:molybdopterin synthase sulfurtransferase
MLDKRGFIKIKVLKGWEESPKFDYCPNYKQLVSCRWVNALITKKLAHSPKEWKIFEVGCGEPITGTPHIPGAGYLDTNLFEKEELMWNKVYDSELMSVLATNGVCFDTTVILYSSVCT